MMVVRLRLPPKPLLIGKILIHNTDKFTILIIIFSGIFLNGRMLFTFCVCSLTTIIFYSAYGTCSSAAVY